MTSPANEIIPVTIEAELKQSYLDYAMSVIVGRALPDVRDGLKPVHRRVLFAMHELGNDWNKAYKKSARIVGDVIGKYHPHGDSAVYDTIVRMAQPFTLRYMLVDGQGNFGSIDGDAAAAMRYTEIRMTRLAHALLADLDKDTVDFVPNYDETEQIPVVLPTRVPHLLINGSSGIAVGMATNIPPHNLKEVINGLLAFMDNPNISITELIQHIPGPDFPTAGIIQGRKGIEDAYRTGRGRIIVRGRTHIETNEKTGRASIVVTELPYQVNKARFLEKIGELVQEKKIEGISELRDESDKDGIRVVIDVRRGEVPEIILNHLIAHTQLQVVFGINNVALDRGQPKTFSLKEMLAAFLQHRREVVTRRSLFELRKARERAHVLEGLAVALANIDEVITLIKTAANPQAAKEQLVQTVWAPGIVKTLLSGAIIQDLRPQDLLESYGLKEEGYRLSPQQAQAILDLRLHRLTGLEVDKIHDEYRALAQQVEDLLKILSDATRLNQVIREDLLAVQAEFGDDRRSEIVGEQTILTEEDLITDEAMVVMLSRQGYVKSQSLTSYQSQRRGGRGKAAATVKEEDCIRTLLVANSHDTLLCFSTFGKVYWLKVYQVPQGSRTARGRPIVNLLPLETEEQITTILPIQSFDANYHIFMVTMHGTVKKVQLDEFAKPRPSGKLAIELLDGDRLVGAALTKGDQELMLVSREGKAIRFHEEEVRVMGRSARGVRGMLLKPGNEVIALIVVNPDATLLTATAKGYGQRTALIDYRPTGRGGQGVGVIRVNERNGAVIGAVQVTNADEALFVTDQGTLVRVCVNEISEMGRNTQGVRLVNLAEGEHLVGVEAIGAELEE